jgi:hypothetical protein
MPRWAVVGSFSTSTAVVLQQNGWKCVPSAHPFAAVASSAMPITRANTTRETLHFIIVEGSTRRTTTRRGKLLTPAALNASDLD